MEIPNNVDVDAVAARIRLLQSESGLGKAAFAKFMGVTYQSLWQWQAGYRTPGFESLVRMSRKANVSMDWLLGETPVNERGESEL